MRIQTYTDYALRVLMYMALKGQEKVTVDEIAGAYGISRNHVMKIVQDLAHQGYVTTVRGRSGGAQLAAPPESISVGALVRGCESNAALVSCFGDSGSCCIASACVLRTAFAEAQEAFFAALDSYTLADLIAPQQALAALLTPADPA